MGNCRKKVMYKCVTILKGRTRNSDKYHLLTKHKELNSFHKAFLNVKSVKKSIVMLDNSVKAPYSNSLSCLNISAIGNVYGRQLAQGKNLYSHKKKTCIMLLQIKLDNFKLYKDYYKIYCKFCDKEKYHLAFNFFSLCGFQGEF